jgi:hypothetical protein
MHNINDLAPELAPADVWLEHTRRLLPKIPNCPHYVIDAAAERAIAAGLATWQFERRKAGETFTDEGPS